MNLYEARDFLQKHFLTEYAGDFPISLDNQPSKTPDIPEKWVRVIIRNNDSSQSSLGRKNNRKFEHLGIIIIQVYTPVNKGTKENDLLSSEIADLMGSFHEGSLWTQESIIRSIGNDDRGYYQQNVVTEFTYEETK